VIHRVHGIRIHRQDGVIEARTSHHAPLFWDGTAFLPFYGDRSAVTETQGLTVDVSEVEVLMVYPSVEREAILAGVYDQAMIEIVDMDLAWSNANALDADDAAIGGVVPQSARLVKRGWIGAITLKDNVYIAEISGLTTPLQRHFGVLFSERCRARLGDHCCRVDLTTAPQTHCDGRFATCCNVFRNAKHFRGEPFMAGLE
jgi:uncharacterized phage protein (TIGR02218 family)